MNMKAWCQGYTAEEQINPPGNQNGWPRGGDRERGLEGQAALGCQNVRKTLQVEEAA